MKDEWERQNREASKTVYQFPEETNCEEVKKLPLKNAEYDGLICILLQDGDILIARKQRTKAQVELWHFPVEHKFQIKRQLSGNGYPKNPELVWFLSDSLFVTVESVGNSTSQTLRVHNTKPNITYETSMIFDKEKLCFIETVKVGESDPTIILGNEKGSIYLIKFSNGTLEKRRKINPPRPGKSVESVRATKGWLWIVWRDGLIKVWDICREKLVGNIDNPETTDTFLDQYHFFTCVYGFLRIHEKKPGLTEKSRVPTRLPYSSVASDEPNRFYRFLPLDEEVGVTHNADSKMVFFDLKTGTPISVVKTSSKKLERIEVLADATLLLISDDLAEDIEILTIEEPENVRDALRQRAKCEYTKPRLDDR